MDPAGFSLHAQGGKPGCPWTVQVEGRSWTVADHRPATRRSSRRTSSSCRPSLRTRRLTWSRARPRVAWGSSSICGAPARMVTDASRFRRPTARPSSTAYPCFVSRGREDDGPYVSLDVADRVLRRRGAGLSDHSRQRAQGRSRQCARAGGKGPVRCSRWPSSGPTRSGRVTVTERLSGSAGEPRAFATKREDEIEPASGKSVVWAHRSCVVVAPDGSRSPSGSSAPPAAVRAAPRTNDAGGTPPGRHVKGAPTTAARGRAQAIHARLAGRLRHALDLSAWRYRPSAATWRSSPTNAAVANGGSSPSA